jgi:hypothetical protein
MSRETVKPGADGNAAQQPKLSPFISWRGERSWRGLGQQIRGVAHFYREAGRYQAAVAGDLKDFARHTLNGTHTSATESASSRVDAWYRRNGRS